MASMGQLLTLSSRINERIRSSTPSGNRRHSKAPSGKQSRRSRGRANRDMLERSGSLRPRQRIGSSACVNQSNHAGALAKTAFNFSVSSAPGRSGRMYLRKYCAMHCAPQLVKRTFFVAAVCANTIWMLFAAFFPCLRFKAALPGTGQWFTNLGVPIEDQKSKIGRYDKIALTIGRHLPVSSSSYRRFRSI